MIQMTGKSPAILQRVALPLRLIHKSVQVTAAVLEAKLLDVSGSVKMPNKVIDSIYTRNVG